MKKFSATLFAICSLLVSAFAQYDSLQIDGDYRIFYQHIPTSYQPSNTYSLVLAFHGGFGSAANLQDQSGLSIKADEEGFIIVYPEGIKNRLGIRTWNAGGCCAYAMENNIDDVGFIDSLINVLLARYAIDADKIYLTGMSNGGFMSYRLACELSHRVAAIAPIACTMAFDCPNGENVAVMHINSYDDSSIPFAGGVGDGASGHYNPPLDSVMTVWASNNGCELVPDTLHNGTDYNHVQWRNCTCNSTVDWYMTHDGGHSWPGGNKGTVFGDPVSSHLNATDMMWDFFQQHTRCGTETGVATQSKREIQLFPNPANGPISMDIIGNETINRMELYTLEGKLLRTTTSATIDVADVEAGLYVIRIIIDDKVFTQKILIDL